MVKYRITEIAVTVGPYSWHHDILLAFILAGVNVFRFNYSHAVKPEDYEFLHEKVLLVRTLAKSYGKVVRIFADCPGMKFRLAKDFQAFGLKSGHDLFLSPVPKPGHVVCAHPEYLVAAQVGSMLYLADGLPMFEIVEKDQGCLRCILRSADTTIEPRKGVTIENVVVGELGLPPVTAGDRNAMRAAVKAEADLLGMSFGASYSQYEGFLTAAVEEGATDIPPGFKYELGEAEHHISAIARRSKFVYLGRGDLGLSVPYQQVPRHARLMARACKLFDAECWMGTEVFPSMITGESYRPTHAEVEGVFRLVEHGATCVVFSGEATNNPEALRAVDALDKVLIQADSEIRH